MGRFEDIVVEATMAGKLKTMPTSPLSVVIQHLQADLRPDGDGMTDRELLTRFVRSRDQDALAALVRRHASMVWGVCRRLLNHHEAEDAFQATFLVLVRKAAAVPRQAVANWLYGVARQTAVRLRATATKRGRRETQVVNMPEPTVAEARDADLQSVLDEELSRLPDHFRGVIVLCDLEGLTRKEAARQLGIPEGSVASRLARARVMLAKRLTQRGVAFSGGSVAAVLSASVSASAPPALVASTIETASLQAAGQAAGVISAKVAALTDETVKTMFATKIKSVLAVVLVSGLALGGVAGLLYQTLAAEQPGAKGGPAAKSDQKPGAEKADQPKPPPTKSDRERMVGNWFIMNEDSGRRKGEMWVITEDTILMNAKDGGANAQLYSHRLDSGMNPKQIDISVIAYNGPDPALGTIKGIYVLDGDELRLCLGARGQGRPEAFPEKPGPGEILILQRASSGATPPKGKGKPPAKTDQELMIGDWVITNADSKYKTDMTWTITKDHINRHSPGGGWQMQWYHRLDASKDPKQIDIAGQLNGPTIIKGIYILDGDELRLCLDDAGKGRPAAFPEKPGRGEVTILKRAKQAAEPPKAKEEHPATKTERKVLTPEQAIKQNQAIEQAIKQSQEKVTVKFKVAAVQTLHVSNSNVIGESAGYHDVFILKEADRFVVQILPPAMDTIRRLGIADEHFKGKVVQVTGRLQPGQPAFGTGQFQIAVTDLTQIEVVKE
jgi:RNA polymerase sigma factor (sigma-70 family)